MASAEQEPGSPPADHGAARHLIDHLALVRSHKWGALCIALTVLVGMMAWSMHKPPVFTAAATIRLGTAQSAMGGAAGALLGPSSTPSVGNELQILKSHLIALEASHDPAAHPTSIIVQENAHRPLETTLRSLGLKDGACTLEVTTQGELPVGDSERRYEFEFSESGRLRVHVGDGARAKSQDCEFKWGVPFTVHGETFVLSVHEGEPWGKRFFVWIRSHMAAARWIHENISVGMAGRSSGIVQVGFAAPTPELSQAISNALAEAYMILRRKRRTGEVQKLVERLATPIDTVSTRLGEKKRQVQQILEAEGVLDIDQQTQDELDRIAALRARIQQLEVEVRTLERRHRRWSAATDRGLEEQILMFGARGPDPITSDISRDYFSLQEKMKEWLRDGKPRDSKKFQGYVASLAEVKERLSARLEKAVAEQVESAEEDLAVTRADLDAAKQELGTARGRRSQLADVKRRVEDLQHDIGIDTVRLAELTANRETIKLSGEAGPIAAQIVDHARRPRRRTSPKLLMEFLTALALSLMCGVAWAYAAEYMDRRISNPDELEAVLDLPLLATVPNFRTVRRSERRGLRGALAPVDVPWSTLSESYRILRAKMRFANREGELRSLAVISALNMEGKSHTTLNLAATMASAGHKVLVVDADMRKPSITKLLKPYLPEPLTPDQEKYGLSYVLENGMLWRGAVFGTGVENMSFMPAGAHAEDPSALLDSDEFKVFLGEVSAEYDYVFFDVPPVLAVADAASFLGALDSVIFLTRYRKCRLDVVRAAMKEIKALGGNVLGLVFNGYDARRAGASAAHAHQARYAYARARRAIALKTRGQERNVGL